MGRERVGAREILLTWSIDFLAKRSIIDNEGGRKKLKERNQKMTTLKQELKKEIERELEVARNLKEQYWNDWTKALDEGDKTGERVAHDLREIAGGEIMAYERMAQWLEIFGGLYEDGEERELKIEGGEKEENGND